MRPVIIQNLLIVVESVGRFGQAHKKNKKTGQAWRRSGLSAGYQA